LYALEETFLYVLKPTVFIGFEEISRVAFVTAAPYNMPSRTFDFQVYMKTGCMHTFKHMKKNHYEQLFDFVEGKKIRSNKFQNMKKVPIYKDEVSKICKDDEDDYKPPRKRALLLSLQNATRHISTRGWRAKAEHQAISADYFRADDDNSFDGNVLDEDEQGEAAYANDDCKFICSLVELSV
jgi:hypothetical protein